MTTTEGTECFDGRVVQVVPPAAADRWAEVSQ